MPTGVCPRLGGLSTGYVWRCATETCRGTGYGSAVDGLGVPGL